MIEPELYLKTCSGCWNQNTSNVWKLGSRSTSLIGILCVFSSSALKVLKVVSTKIISKCLEEEKEKLCQPSLQEQSPSQDHLELACSFL